MSFQLGEQPEWAGQEENKKLEVAFIQELLEEGAHVSLKERGYALVKLDRDERAHFDAFSDAFVEFSLNGEEETKRKYAQLQFGDELQHSSNQFHGYSRVEGLKEQLMLRMCGAANEDLAMPLNGNDSESENSVGTDFGVAANLVYNDMDRLSRQVLSAAVRSLEGIEDQERSQSTQHSSVKKILDPVYEWAATVSRTGVAVQNSYLPPNFVSSSILDCFHYFGLESPHGNDRFHNNHAAHTDSGLVTVVVTTDRPGLDVYDQKEEAWVGIEQLVHHFCAENGETSNISKDTVDETPWRDYAILFLSDSTAYIDKRLRPCLHRVSACGGGRRFSIVFKQRTMPSATACRYQEDYILLEHQLRALDENYWRKKALVACLWSSKHVCVPLARAFNCFV